MEGLKDILFEAAFDHYLTDEIHEEVEETIFGIVRNAFDAGWNAAHDAYQIK